MPLHSVRAGPAVPPVLRLFSRPGTQGRSARGTTVRRVSWTARRKSVLCQLSAQADAAFESPLTTLGKKRDNSRFQLGKSKTPQHAPTELDTVSESRKRTPLERGSQWVLEKYALQGYCEVSEEYDCRLEESLLAIATMLVAASRGGGSVTKEEDRVQILGSFAAIGHRVEPDYEYEGLYEVLERLEWLPEKWPAKRLVLYQALQSACAKENPLKPGGEAESAVERMAWRLLVPKEEVQELCAIVREEYQLRKERLRLIYPDAAALKRAAKTMISPDQRMAEEESQRLKQIEQQLPIASLPMLPISMKECGARWVLWQHFGMGAVEARRWLRRPFDFQRRYARAVVALGMAALTPPNAAKAQQTGPNTSSTDPIWQFRYDVAGYFAATGASPEVLEFILPTEESVMKSLEAAAHSSPVEVAVEEIATACKEEIDEKENVEDVLLFGRRLVYDVCELLRTSSLLGPQQRRRIQQTTELLLDKLTGLDDGTDEEHKRLVNEQKSNIGAFIVESENQLAREEEFFTRKGDVLFPPVD
eukprot:scaffold2033_cov367-Prasinococcus_capsulatus_cf.AAC.10